jgi:hypothetical protein
MNIAFLAPGVLQKEGGGTAVKYKYYDLIPGADRTTKQQKD